MFRRQGKVQEVGGTGSGSVKWQALLLMVLELGGCYQRGSLWFVVCGLSRSSVQWLAVVNRVMKLAVS